MPAPRWILVVDDDAAMLQMLVEFVDALPGFRATSASDAYQAFVQARDLKPALIISDMQMPNYFGTAILIELRKDPKTRDTPFIFVSGMEPEKLKDLLPRNEPRVRVLAKPIDWPKLGAWIDEMTSLQAETAPAERQRTRLLFDSTVFIQAFDVQAAGHVDSLLLLKELERLGTAVLVPAHAWFKALRVISLIHPGKVNVPVNLISIDQAFLERYSKAEVPDLDAGDPLLVAIAKTDGLPLITWDKAAIGVFKMCGAQAMTPSELLLDLKAKTA